MHLSNVTVTLTQLAASVSRVFAYAVATLFLGNSEDNKSVLLALGYVPFLALIDVLTQAYSRALSLKNQEKLHLILKNRIYIAIPFLLLILATFLNSAEEIQRTGALIIVLAYSLSGLGQIFESWTAQRPKAFLSALIEISLNLGLLSLHAFDEQLKIHSALALLISFPLSRLLILATDINRTVSATSAPTQTTKITSYILFSLAQQLVAATASSLPSIYSQATGDYSNLDRNLVIFRITHTAATLGSFIINAIGSRIFYGTIGNSFYRTEELFIQSNRTVRFIIFLCLIIAATTSLSSTPHHIPFAFLITSLALLNLESSLLINAGLPSHTLYFQACVLFLSLALLLNIQGFIAYSAFIAIVTGLQFYFLSKNFFLNHLAVITTRRR